MVLENIYCKVLTVFFTRLRVWLKNYKNGKQRLITQMQTLFQKQRFQLPFTTGRLSDAIVWKSPISELRGSLSWMLALSPGEGLRLTLFTLRIKKQWKWLFVWKKRLRLMWREFGNVHSEQHHVDSYCITVPQSFQAIDKFVDHLVRFVTSISRITTGTFVQVTAGNREGNIWQVWKTLHCHTTVCCKVTQYYHKNVSVKVRSKFAN